MSGLQSYNSLPVPRPARASFDQRRRPLPGLDDFLSRASSKDMSPAHKRAQQQWKRLRTQLKWVPVSSFLQLLIFTLINCISTIEKEQCLHCRRVSRSSVIIIIMTCLPVRLEDMAKCIHKHVVQHTDLSRANLYQDVLSFSFHKAAMQYVVRDLHKSKLTCQSIASVTCCMHRGLCPSTSQSLAM